MCIKIWYYSFVCALKKDSFGEKLVLLYLNYSCADILGSRNMYWLYCTYTGSHWKKKKKMLETLSDETYPDGYDVI